jgi:hypothetical protein
MSLLVEDYDTFETLLFSAVSNPSELVDIQSDLNDALESIATTGSLPASIADRTEQFLSGFQSRIVSPLLSQNSVGDELDVVKSVLAGVIACSLKGFELGNDILMTSVCELVWEEGVPLYQCNSGLHGAIVDFFRSGGGAAKLKSAVFGEGLRGDLLWSAVSLLQKEDGDLDYSDLSEHTIASISADFEANERSVNMGSLLSLFDSIAAKLAGENDFVLRWVPLSLSFISSEVFDVRLGGLTLLAKIVSNKDHADAAVAIFLSIGIDAILTVPLHTGFGALLGTIYGFLAEQDLLRRRRSASPSGWRRSRRSCGRSSPCRRRSIRTSARACGQSGGAGAMRVCCARACARRRIPSSLRCGRRSRTSASGSAVRTSPRASPRASSTKSHSSGPTV